MHLSSEEYRRVISVMPIVCVDCLVMNERREVLLVRRGNEPLKGEYWLPGGRVHKGERLVDAVHRKMREEIGVEVEVVGNVGFFEFFHERTEQNATGGVHSISFVYIVRPHSYVITLDNQSSDWGWFKRIPVKLKECIRTELVDIDE